MDLVAPEKKIFTLEEACLWRKSLRKQDIRLVITNGCFDLMHRGHADYLYRARCEGDAMLILCNSDASVRALKGPTRPIVGEYDRAFLLASLAVVDGVVIFDSPRCDRELAALAPDVYVKAGDYTVETLDAGERNALLQNNTRIVFMPFIAGLSTTNIIQKIKAE